MAYRVVLSETFLGTVLENRGPPGPITTALIVAALLFLFGSHCAMFGAGCVTSWLEQRLRRTAVAQCSSMGLMILIILGKMSTGTIYYAQPCCSACPAALE